MISIIDNDNRYNLLLKLSKGNPYGCRIISLYNTYNYNLPFVDFWIQFVDDKPVSLISRLENAFVLRLTDSSDLDEISSFIRVFGVSALICDNKYKLKLDLAKTSGPVLYSKYEFEIENSFEICTPTVKEAYSVIVEANSDNFSVPSYESFTLDVSHKLKQRSVRMLAVKEDNIVVACIMTLAESRDSAVLGALATLPDYRKKGYGAFLIKYINNTLINEGKRVYLHRAPDENIEFYNKLGFKEYGYWAEYKE